MRRKTLWRPWLLRERSASKNEGVGPRFLVDSAVDERAITEEIATIKVGVSSKFWRVVMTRQEEEESQIMAWAARVIPSLEEIFEKDEVAGAVRDGDLLIRVTMNAPLEGRP